VTAQLVDPTTGASAAGRPVSGWRRWATSIEVAAIAGIVCAVAWSVSLRGLLSGPGLGASRAEIALFYTDHADGGHVGLLLALMMVGAVAYLWFVGVVRSRLGARESRLVGTVFLGASVLLTGLMLVAASVLAAPSILLDVGGQQPDPGGTALLRALAAVVLSVFTARVAIIVMFTTASLGLRTGALPRWLVVVTFVVGIVEFFIVTLSTPTLYVFPAWIALVSLVLLVRRPQLAPEGVPRS
jgi:hypothetical protein